MTSAHTEASPTQRELARLRHELAIARHYIGVLEHALTQREARIPGEAPPRHAVSKRELTRLISSCHPDKWADRPATDLAHLVTSALLELRDRAGND